MELGTEDYYYQEHQYEDAHHEAVLAGGFTDLEGDVGLRGGDGGAGEGAGISPTKSSGDGEKAAAGRQAAVAASRAKRRAQAKAAHQASAEQIRQASVGGGGSGPAVTAAALRRQRIAKIQDFSLRYIVRCRLPPPEELEAEERAREKEQKEKEALLANSFASFRKSTTTATSKEEGEKKDAANLVAKSSGSSSSTVALEDLISVEQLELIMLHFYDQSAVDLQTLLQREMKAMKLKANENRATEHVKGQRTEWVLNSGAVGVVKSEARPSLQLLTPPALSVPHNKQTHRVSSLSVGAKSIETSEGIPPRILPNKKTSPRRVVAAAANGARINVEEDEKEKEKEKERRTKSDNSNDANQQGNWAEDDNNNTSTNYRWGSSPEEDSALPTAASSGPFAFESPNPSLVLDSVNGPSEVLGLGNARARSTNSSTGQTSAPARALGHAEATNDTKEAGATSVANNAECRRNSSSSNTLSSRLSTSAFIRHRRSLNEKEFIQALQSVLGASVASTEECKAWFKQIDFENSGVVGWEAFSSFLLSLGEHRTHVDNRPFAIGIKLYPSSCHPWNRHSGPITCCIVHPATGAIFTGGEDGLILAWHPTTLRNQTLIHRGTSWIVGLQLLHDGGRLAAATVERELLIFDLKAGEMIKNYKGKCDLKGEMGLNYAYSSGSTVAVNEKLVGHLTPRNAKVTSNRADNREKYRRLKSGAASHIPMNKDEMAMIAKGAREERAVDAKRLEQAVLLGLEEAPTCMDYHYSAIDQDLIFFGTRCGAIAIYDITNVHNRVIKCFYKLQPHKKRVNKIEVLPLLEAILSCSDDCSLKLTSLETGAVLRDFSKECGGHNMSVSTFAFSQACKIFISVSNGERRALVWDYLQESPIYTLEEHSAPLLSACINEKDKHIITLSADNTVRIIDVITHKTLQTVNHKAGSGNSLGRSSSVTGGGTSSGAVGGEELAPNFVSMVYDQLRHRHFVLSSFPQMYKLRQSEHIFPPHYSGHVAPVVHLTYTPSNRQLVSFDAESCIVWDYATGNTRFSYPYTRDFSSAIEEFRLTATGWDESQRRLLCGYHNGTMVVWNYSNGQAVNVVQSGAGGEPLGMYGAEVSAVMSTTVGGTSMYLYGVGRRLLLCPESQQFTIVRASSYMLPAEHGALTALGKINSHLIIMGTSSGALLVYNVSRGGDEAEGKAMLASDYTDGGGASPFSNPLTVSPRNAHLSADLGQTTSHASTPTVAASAFTPTVSPRGTRTSLSLAATAPLGITSLTSPFTSSHSGDGTNDVAIMGSAGPANATSRSRSTSLAAASSPSVAWTPRHLTVDHNQNCAPPPALTPLSAAKITNPSIGLGPRRPSAFQAEVRRQAAITTSRVERIFVIDKPELEATAPLILAVHNDGRGVLWHSSKRTFICSLFFTGAGGSSASCFDMDSLSFETLAYADALGNVTVWDINYEQVSLMETLRRHTRNPTVAADVRQFISNTSETIPSIESGSKVRTCFFAGHGQHISSVVVIPSSHRTALASNKKAASATMLEASMRKRAGGESVMLGRSSVEQQVGGGDASILGRSTRKQRGVSALNVNSINPSSGGGAPRINGGAAPTQPPSTANTPESSMMIGAFASPNPGTRRTIVGGGAIKQSNASTIGEKGDFGSVSFNFNVKLNDRGEDNEVTFPSATAGGSNGHEQEHHFVYYQPTIATSGADCLVRLWTIDGACIGEYGMRKWALEKQLSWRATVPEAPHEGLLVGGRVGKQQKDIFTANDTSVDNLGSSPSALRLQQQHELEQSLSSIMSPPEHQQQRQSHGVSGVSKGVGAKEHSLGDSDVEGLSSPLMPSSPTTSPTRYNATSSYASATTSRHPPQGAHDTLTTSSTAYSFLPPLPSSPRSGAAVAAEDQKTSPSLHTMMQNASAEEAFHVPHRYFVAGKQTLAYLAPNTAAVEELVGGGGERSSPHEGDEKVGQGPKGAGLKEKDALFTSAAPRPALEKQRLQQQQQQTSRSSVGGGVGVGAGPFVARGSSSSGEAGIISIDFSDTTRRRGGGGGRNGILKPRSEGVFGYGLGTGGDSFLDTSMAAGAGHASDLRFNMTTSNFNVSSPFIKSALSPPARLPQAPSSSSFASASSNKTKPLAAVRPHTREGPLPATDKRGISAANACVGISTTSTTTTTMDDYDTIREEEREGGGGGGGHGDRTASAGSTSSLGHHNKSPRRALTTPVAHGLVLGEIPEEEEEEDAKLAVDPATNKARSSPSSSRRSVVTVTLGLGAKRPLFSKGKATTRSTRNSKVSSANDPAVILEGADDDDEQRTELVEANSTTSPQTRLLRSRSYMDDVVLDLPFAVDVGRGSGDAILFHSPKPPALLAQRSQDTDLVYSANSDRSSFTQSARLSHDERRGGSSTQKDVRATTARAGGVSQMFLPPPPLSASLGDLYGGRAGGASDVAATARSPVRPRYTVPAPPLGLSSPRAAGPKSFTKSTSDATATMQQPTLNASTPHRAHSSLTPPTPASLSIPNNLSSLSTTPTGSTLHLPSTTGTSTTGAAFLESSSSSVHTTSSSIAMSVVKARQGRLAQYGLGAGDIKAAQQRLHNAAAGGGLTGRRSGGVPDSIEGGSNIVDQIRDRREARLYEESLLAAGGGGLGVGDEGTSEGVEGAGAPFGGSSTEGKPSSVVALPPVSPSPPGRYGRSDGRRGAAGGRESIADTIARLSSRIVVVDISEVHAPEMSIEAQEDARRGGRRERVVYGVKAAGQSLAPSFTAANAMGGGGGGSLAAGKNAPTRK